MKEITNYNCLFCDMLITPKRMTGDNKENKACFASRLISVGRVHSASTETVSFSVTIT